MDKATIDIYTSQDEKDLYLQNIRILDSVKEKYEKGIFLYDGFFPGYLSQLDYKNKPMRVLFIAWECYLRPNQDDYIMRLYEELNYDIFPNKVYSGSIFDAIIPTIYGIIKGREYVSFVSPQITSPRQNILSIKMREEHVSFALINISKITNINGSNSNKSCLKQWAREKAYSGNNLIESQIALLAPTLIIGMNLIDNKLLTNHSSPIQYFPNKDDRQVQLTTITVNCKNYPYLDTYHFSKQSSYNIQKILFDPIMDAVDYLRKNAYF